MIRLAALAPRLNSDPQNIEGWNRSAQSFLKQTEYIYSTFDVRCSLVFFSIRPAAFLAGDGTDPPSAEHLTPSVLYKLLPDKIR